MAEAKDTGSPRRGTGKPMAEPATDGKAVPMHHRLKLGHMDAGTNSPNGVGNPSRVPSTGGREKGW